MNNTKIVWVDGVEIEILKDDSRRTELISGKRFFISEAENEKIDNQNMAEEIKKPAILSKQALQNTDKFMTRDVERIIKIIQIIDPDIVSKLSKYDRDSFNDKTAKRADFDSKKHLIGL